MATSFFALAADLAAALVPTFLAAFLAASEAFLAALICLAKAAASFVNLSTVSCAFERALLDTAGFILAAGAAFFATGLRPAAFLALAMIYISSAMTSL
ncbi:MAG: hypothetical protein COA99_14695 [Moraxellaceae bacterium]|nr:MAG: hypothetical protein COA99_14695 [Moraxellaceae bacterium]